eukprot:g17046.t1
MKRLWDLSPINFVRELLRTYNGEVVPVYQDPAHEDRFIVNDLPVAGYDPSVFPHPDIFDQTRDLKDVVVFNGLEGQITGEINSSDTLSRVCIGRQFVLESMVSVIPFLFPVELQYAPVPDIEVWGKDGLYLVPKKNPVPLEAPHIEIYRLMTTGGKKYNNRQRSGQDLLLVFETDVFEAPQFWMPTMEQLVREPGKISEIWVLNPTIVGPHLNQSGQMAAILSAAKSGEGWKMIVLASVSQLSWITARQLEGKTNRKPSVLDGLFAFDSPHPFAFQQLSMKKSSDNIFPYKFPIAPMGVRAEQYKALRQLWEGEEGWSTAMEGSLLKVFTRWGPQRMLAPFDKYAYDESNDQYNVGRSELGMSYDYSVMHVGNVPVYMMYEKYHNLWEWTIQGVDYGEGAHGLTRTRWSHPDEVAENLREFCKQVTTARFSLFYDVLSGTSSEDTTRERQTAKALAVILSFVSTYAGWCLETFVSSQLEAGVRNPRKCLGFVAFFSASIFGVPFLLLSLWKLGLPELHSYVVKFKCHDGAARLGDLFNIVGMLIHHFGAFFTFYLVVFQGAGMYTTNLMGLILPLFIQHTVGSFKYWNKYVHDVLLIVVDMWFQLEFWAFFYNTQSQDWVVAGITTIYIAHLLYWCGGFCEYFVLIMEKRNPKR